MKKRNWRLGTILGLVVAMLTVFALGSNRPKQGPFAVHADDVSTKTGKKTTITFWNAMSGSASTALKQMTADFEKAHPNIEVKLENQGDYSDLQGKLNSTMQNPSNLPTITQAYPQWLYTAVTNGQLVDLKPYFDNSKIGFGSIQRSNIAKPFLEGATIKGKQYGVPFNKSTEVLFYNPDLLKKYGVKVPKTMAQLKQASKEIYEKSNHKVVGTGFDALNNYYVIGMKGYGDSFTSKLNFDSKDSKKVINYYADGVKDGYFQIAGAQKYMYLPFTNGKVAMFVGSSSSEQYIKPTHANYAVAARPSKNNLQQGTDIYMFKNASKAQRTAAFEYMKFLTEPKQQLYWAKTTGYMPVNNEVLKSASYKNLAGTKVPAVVSNSTENMFTMPVVKNSNTAFVQLNQIMQDILTHPNSNRNQLIKQNAQKLKSAWNQ